MSLREKTLNLKLQAASALRLARFWENAIDQHGEQKATAFYTHLGLNHLETKSGVEWEGLTLSREPKEHEKIAVKGVAQAQESSQEAIGKILLALREELITDGLSSIKKLKPQNLHELVLSPSKESYSDLRDRLIKVHRQGRVLVARELERQSGKAWLAEGSWQHPVDFDLVHDRNRFGPHDAKCVGYECDCDITHQPECKLNTKFRVCSCEYKAAAEDEFDELDDLTSLTESRVANDVQARIVDATTRYSLLGLSGKELLSAVESEITGGSVSYIDRAARGLANRVINIGRTDEMAERADDIERYEQSALLDANVCEPCAEDDGQTANNPDDLPGGPNPSCLGSDQCRCFVVAVAV